MLDPRQIHRGQAISAQWLNQVVNTITSMITGGRGITVRRAGNKIVVERRGGAADIVPYRQFIKAKIADASADVKDDYIECDFYDPVGDATAGAVNVAKPFPLQRTPFDGETITDSQGETITYTYTDNREREADDGSDTETQLLTPDYHDGEILTALRVNTGLTDASGYAILYEEFSPGRHWAQEL